MSAAPSDAAGRSAVGVAPRAAATEVSLIPGVRHGNGKAVVSFRYGTTLTLTPDTANPLFGHAVTFTAAVAPANAVAGTPGGSVSFSDGTRTLATVPVSDGLARFSTAGLQPGSHTVTAHYSGDAEFTPSDPPAPAEMSVGFSGPCLTAEHHGALTVAAGESVCIGSGGAQTGPVVVQQGGALAVSDARITGPLTADGALAVTLCRSQLAGPVTVNGTSGHVLIGGTADGTDGCGGNAITGPLRCAGNEPAPFLSGNTVKGPRFGQCG
ncbi:Ig-like domain-containing protein [Streptomyces sp. NPDC048258]|uniref:Ig-like domain-containing protein n=1 Tax=Streptomyces sp. NPDC048258 TaxID=3365527 RepID=UPI003712D1FB